jgi:hypothetical protein
VGRTHGWRTGCQVCGAGLVDAMDRRHALQADALVITGTASLAGAVGYGDVYEFRIRSVLAGTVDESRIMITILAADRQYSSFIASHLDPVEIEIRFTRTGVDEPYRLAPITGFVDKDRNAWMVTSMQAVMGQ